MKYLKNAFTLTLLAAICSVGVADDQKTKEHKARTSNGRQQMLTEYFAGKLMLMNHSTILMSDMAARETSSEDVMQFANTLHRAHAKLNRQLSDSAPDIAAITTLDSAGKPHATGFRGSPPVEREETVGEQAADREVTADQTDHRRQKKSANGLLQQILSIERQATSNYLQSSTEMLSKYKGQDFDMGFLGLQIGQHTWALAELKAMKSVGDDDFQKLISDATKQVEQHLNEARRLSKQYEDDRNQQTEE